jgi:hypothetical protein
MTRRIQLCLMMLAVAVQIARAQGPIGFGLAAGGLKLSDLQREQALRAFAEINVASWLSFSASPVYLRAQTDSAGVTYSSRGFGDLGLAVGTGFGFAHAPGAPDVWGSLEMTLPTGSTACGLGSGTTSYSLDAGGGLSVTDGWYASASMYAPMSGESGQSSLHAPHASSLSAGLSFQASDRVAVSSTIEVDVGTADSTQALSRVLGGGVNIKLAGPLALQFEGRAGLTSASPRWAFAIGLGTALGYTGPVDVHAPQQLLGNVFHGGVGRGKGRGRVGGKNKNATPTSACQ